MTVAQAIMVRPVAITGARLTSSTVPEAPGSAYNAFASYALGDRVYVGTVGAALTVYQSLQAANLGNTPASSPLWWAEVADTYAEYSSGVSYALAAIVIDAAAHLEYRSLAAANLGNALTDATKWQALGNTNRYKASDQSPESQMVQYGVLTEVITPGVIADVLTFINVAGVASIRVQSSSGYDETVELLQRSTPNYYAWAFEPFVYRSDVVFRNLEPNPANVITITVTPLTGGEAAVGCRILGRSKNIGKARFNTSVGIVDYSIKADDGFGNTIVTDLGYSKRMRAPILLDSAGVNVVEAELLRTFAAYRATPVVWVMSPDRDITIVYGYYRDFDLVIPGPTHTTYQLSVEGLK